MTHPPATCELCGDTGLYSPSALPCPKGCKEFDIVQQANDVLQAMSDWAVTYAPDMCGDEMVKQAKARVFQQGTLAYIADATDKLRNVITALSEAEQREKDAYQRAYEARLKRHKSGCACHLDDDDSIVSMCELHKDVEKDARGKALEEAATVAEAEYKRHCTGSGFDSQPSRSTAHSILEAIRALKDEVR